KVVGSGDCFSPGKFGPPPRGIVEWCSELTRAVFTANQEQQDFFSLRDGGYGQASEYHNTIETSKDNSQARSRSLYRDWYRAAPEICQLYALDVPYPTLRAKIRQIFDRYSHLKDTQAIDVLIAKSHMEYQEFVNVWKMPSQVMRYFESEQAPPVPNSFMDKFLAGKDDNAVLPGA
ncbi:hypothetical protein MJO28_010018, partial [Puccinia striiformis f. sp. tritici]